MMSAYAELATCFFKYIQIQYESGQSRRSRLNAGVDNYAKAIICGGGEDYLSEK